MPKGVKSGGGRLEGVHALQGTEIKSNKPHTQPTELGDKSLAKTVLHGVQSIAKLEQEGGRRWLGAEGGGRHGGRSTESWLTLGHTARALSDTRPVQSCKIVQISILHKQQMARTFLGSECRPNPPLLSSTRSPDWLRTLSAAGRCSQGPQKLRKRACVGHGNEKDETVMEVDNTW